MPIILNGNGPVSGVTSITGAGLDLITAQTFSGLSSVSVNNCFTAVYQNYRLVFSGTGSGDALLRLRAGGVDNTSSDYRMARYFVGHNVNVAFTSVTNNTQTNMILGNASSNDSVFSADLFNPHLAVNTLCVSNAAGPLLQTIAGSLLNSVSFDGCTVYASSGTLTGSLRIYGYRNS